MLLWGGYNEQPNARTMKKRARVLLLGASGSIGKNTLSVLKAFPEEFSLVGVSVKTNTTVLFDIVERHAVESVHIDDRSLKKQLQRSFSGEIFTGKEGLLECIEKSNADMVLNAISGEAGLPATEKAIERGMKIALANKESLVMAGLRLLKRAKETGAEIFPVDSEHSSLAELLSKTERGKVKRLWLTASGGPFRDAQKFPKSSFPTISKEQALNHPTWKMGAKISIDSATMMNKAFELIEAVRLFDFPAELFRVVVHPESIVHGAIELCDGSVIMDCSSPDMKLPIARALFRAAGKELPQEFSVQPYEPFEKSFHFEALDEERFPSLQFAKKALKNGEDDCAELVRRNDSSVELFLTGKIRFDEIFTRLGEGFS